MSAAALKIAVIVDNLRDHHLLGELLGNRHCQYFDRHQLIANSDKHFESIIVCHRKSIENPTPHVPTPHSPSRIIVISDCTYEDQIVLTLHSGAHHFINWQQSENVLTARIDAALRWHPRREHRVLDVSPFKFQMVNRSVFCDEQRVDLIPREFELAYYLFNNRDRVILDSELLTGIWTLPSSMDTRRIDTAICRIRHKLGLQLASSQWTLVRLRRQGYRLTCQVAQEMQA